MRLLIISHMPHHRRDGKIVGWGPTATEISYLARRFREIRHIACLHPEPAPASDLSYDAPNVTLVPVPPSGGPRLRDKLGIVTRWPVYLRTIRRELESADVVHVRCPANISLLAILYLSLRRQPRLRWVKYAGNWRPAATSGEAWSYALQRWWLDRGLHRGLVTINGEWPGQPPHVHSFPNPSLTRAELVDAARRIAGKLLEPPYRLLFVGRIEEPKGADRAIRILARLRQAGIDAELELIGDGPERRAFESLSEQLGIQGSVSFHGWQPRPELARAYAEAHFLILPSRSSEGWPKVLSEAMAYGVVPVASDVSSIPQTLARCATGQALPAQDLDAFARALTAYAEDPRRWQDESAAGRRAADHFTYEHYLERVEQLLDLPAQMSLEP